jgi:diaminopimelate decarboxylase
VESLDEVASLAEAADAEGVSVDVGIRVNPDVSASTHPYISTGKGGIKFGVPSTRWWSRHAASRRIRGSG